MGEGRQTEAGEREARPRDNVVRLPRDWLAPREELVPFGPRAASPEAYEPPPSPADFWGEQSGELQRPLQGPAVPDDGDVASRFAPEIHPSRVDRRMLASVAVILAVAAVAIVALVSSPVGPRQAPQPPGGSDGGFAAVLSGGVSSVLRLDLGRTAVARVATPNVRRTPHRESAPARSKKPSRPRPHTSVRTNAHVASHATPATVASSPSYHPTTTETSATRNTGATETHPSAPTRSASRPVASRATVSATGESGALGPVQSPNG